MLHLIYDDCNEYKHFEIHIQHASIRLSLDHRRLSKRSHSDNLHSAVMIQNVLCHTIGGWWAMMSPRGAEQYSQFSMSLEEAWGKAYLGTMTQRVK